MILTCPDCATRFSIKAGMLGPAGRKVRCSRCGHVWHQDPRPDDDARTIAVGRTFADALADTGADEPTEVRPFTPRRETARAVAGKGEGRRLPAGWIGFGVAVAALLAGTVLGRDAVVAAWEPAALLYRTIGMPVEAPGAGLELPVPELEVRRENGTATLVLAGRVVNASDRERAVPPIIATARGADGEPVHTWTIMASHERLLPGEIAIYQSAEPDPGGVGAIVLRFEGG